MNQTSTAKNKTDQQSRETQILNAAANLFAHKGFHRTTTKDIARASDVSEGTLYNYFESKNEILMAIMSKLSSARGQQNVRAISDDEDVRDVLHAILEDRQNFIRENRDMLKAVYSEILVDPVMSDRYYSELLLPLILQIEEQIQKRMQTGEIRPVDPKVSARLLVGIINGIFILSILGDPIVHQQWEVLDEAIVELFFKGYQG
jgi:AcrR family transcriptional regulator